MLSYFFSSSSRQISRFGVENNFFKKKISKNILSPRPCYKGENVVVLFFFKFSPDLEISSRKHFFFFFFFFFFFGTPFIFFFFFFFLTHPCGVSTEPAHDVWCNSEGIFQFRPPWAPWPKIFRFLTLGYPLELEKGTCWGLPDQVRGPWGPLSP
jgi:hypothetical protein